MSLPRAKASCFPSLVPAVNILNGGRGGKTCSAQTIVLPPAHGKVHIGASYRGVASWRNSRGMIVSGLEPRLSSRLILRPDISPAR